MGRAPVASGAYASIEGGYLYQDGADVRGYGMSTAPAQFRDVLVSPTDGWFAGGLISLGNGGVLIQGLPFTRVEVYGLFGRLEDSASADSPPFANISLKNDDATVNISGAGRGHTRVERQMVEGGLRLEGDQTTGGGSTLTWVLSPFVRGFRENTDTDIFGCCIVSRSADVNTNAYGVLLAIEPEFQIASGIMLAARAGAGVYGYNASGDFRSSSTLAGPDPFLGTVHDSTNGAGFRGELGAELKIEVTPGANLETFAEADYFSQVGSADLANSQPTSAGPSRIEMDDQWELRAGARLTFGLGGP